MLTLNSFSSEETKLIKGHPLTPFSKSPDDVTTPTISLKSVFVYYWDKGCCNTYCCSRVRTDTADVNISTGIVCYKTTMLEINKNKKQKKKDLYLQRLYKDSHLQSTFFIQNLHIVHFFSLKY